MWEQDGDRYLCHHLLLATGKLEGVGRGTASSLEAGMTRTSEGMGVGHGTGKEFSEK